MKRLLIASAISVSLLSGCFPFFGSTVPGAIDQFEVAGAKSLFIAGGSSSGPYRIASGASSAPALYRMNADHSFQRVASKDRSGQKFERAPYPLGIWDVNSEYVCLSFGANGEATKGLDGTYLVRKSDGKAAKIGPSVAVESYKPPVKVDGSGILYFVAEGVLRRLDPRTMDDKLVITEISNRDREFVYQAFAVDPAGNVYTGGALLSGEPGPPGSRMPSMNGYLKLFKAGGGVQILKTLENTGSTYGRFWTGANGRVFLEMGGIHRAEIGADGNATLTLLPEAEAFSGTAHSGTMLVRVGDKLYNPSGNTFKVFSESDERTTHVTWSQLATVTKLQALNKVFYALGKNSASTDVLVRFDPESGEEKLLYSADASLSLYNFAAIADAEVIVNALRLTDGAFVTGRVEEGSFTELSANTPKVQQVVVFQ